MHTQLPGRGSPLCLLVPGPQPPQPHPCACRSWHEGRELPVEELARQYGVDAELLRRVLRYNSVPAVQQAEDGRLIGSWPE